MHLWLAQVATTPAPSHDLGFYSLLSVLYGIVEGLTEFLPVSSTAHLRVVEACTNISLDSGYWKMYSVVIQLGAILTVPLLYADRIRQFLRTFPRGEAGDKTLWTHPLSLVMIGFVVTAGPCYYADKYIGKNLESTLVMALSMLIGGIVMWVVDVLCSRPKVMTMDQMGVLDAIWIGAVQILSAVFPGTSRSMSTIAAGQVFKLSRSTALDYSFFLSIPTMLAATGYKLLQALAHRPKTADEIAAYNAPPGQWIVLLIGFAVSFVVALLVNRWFIHWVRKHGFAPFAVYRLLAGAALLVWALHGTQGVS
jgi:undecaprenyl-diphosphatase